MTSFAKAIIDWQKVHGRHDLPWQNTTDPYAIWVSEIMLQQTQVAAVIGYYDRFMRRFPDIDALSKATQEEVLQYWSGLGYYSRARNLHNAAQKIIDDFHGIFPQDFEDILTLPGIGKSTAAAISTFAFNQPMPILDGNVKRVFARHFNIHGWPGTPRVEQAMWQIAHRENPADDAVAYTQGLMDLGATLCSRSRPRCDACPVKSTCQGLAQNLISQLPTPKPKQAIPQRNCVMLVHYHAGEVLLEKRASTGIWGGLWSFPEVENIPDDAELLPALTHTFTHFKLQIQPALIFDKRQSNAPNTLWLTPDEALEAAIPTPIRKILQTLKTKKAA
ncbi:MAG TPA: A/G-specific adenine glycosylase [Methylophilus sp.]|nr:A/G-specific adenine glycosylase [Methylophilus sp.]HQQ32369.1 A/G-specific adenine glycosylase [Methylophilus sp.]